MNENENVKEFEQLYNKLSAGEKDLFDLCIKSVISLLLNISKQSANKQENNNEK